MSAFDAIRTIVTSGHRKYNREKPLCLYRCTECGYLAFTEGGLHGHIEGHRRLWNFWRIGWDVEWLKDRTELLWLVEVDTERESAINWEDAKIPSRLRASREGQP